MRDHRVYMSLTKDTREQLNYFTRIEYSYVEKILDICGVDLSYTIFMKKCAVGEIIACEPPVGAHYTPPAPGDRMVLHD